MSEDEELMIWTGRYHDRTLARHPEVAKVGITVGLPRWPVGYPFTPLRLLAPEASTLRMECEPFTVAYRAKLDRLTLPVILGELERIADEQGTRQVALLCYEDLRKSDEWCHRQLLAAWLREHGITVEEWPSDSPQPQAAESEAAVEQQRLI